MRDQQSLWWMMTDALTVLLFKIGTPGWVSLYDQSLLGCLSSPGLCLLSPHVLSGPCHRRWGADYLLKTLVYDTTNGSNLTGLIYQVGNLTTDSLFWGRPEDITMKRPYYVASADSMSDLGEASPLEALPKQVSSAPHWGRQSVNLADCLFKYWSWCGSDIPVFCEEVR